MMRWPHLIFLLCCWCLAGDLLPARAAEPSTLWQEKQYQPYLDNAVQLLAAPDFVTIARVAMALEKTQGWDAPAGRQARQLLAQNPDGTRSLDSLRLLVSGQTEGMTALLEGPLPKYKEIVTVIPELREHGFPLASDCFKALLITGQLAFGWQDEKTVRDGVQAWAGIPAAKRGPVTAVVVKRLSIMYRVVDEVMEEALRQALAAPSAPEQGPGAGDYTGILIAVGTGTPNGRLSLTVADRLLDANKPAEAGMVIEACLRKSAWDSWFTADTVRRYWTRLDPQRIQALYTGAIANTPRPEQRDHLLAYLTWLKSMADGNTAPADLTNALQSFRTDADPLIRADMLLVENAASRAKEIYTTAVQGKGTLQERLRAWSGLLDTDPQQALALALPLCDEIAQEREETRGRLLFRYVRQLVKTAGRCLPMEAGVPSPYALPGFTRIDAVPGWEEQLAAILDHALAVDAGCCFVPNGRDESGGLRVECALLYAVAGQSARVNEVLAQQIVVQVPPPPGGWSGGPGMAKPADADQPRPYRFPYANMVYNGAVRVVTVLAKYPPARRHVPAISATLVAMLAERLTRDGSTDQPSMFRQAYGNLLTQSIPSIEQSLAADPPTAPAEWQQAFTQDLELAMQHKDFFANGLPPCERELLSRAIGTAKTPQIQKALCHLLDLLLHKSCSTVTTTPIILKKSILAICQRWEHDGGENITTELSVLKQKYCE